jgi:hypothetical protein
MLTETAVVVAAIVAMFAIYAAALIWADFYTQIITRIEDTYVAAWPRSVYPPRRTVIRRTA